MSLKKNLLANYIGQGWVALMGLAFIPVYIKLLGAEAYGLIGVYMLLQAWMVMFDMGMTPSLNREMARFLAGARSATSIRDLLRSMEWVGGGLAFLIVAVVWLAASWVAHSWLKIGQLSVDTVVQAVTIMGFVLALRLWEEIYRGAIRGMQRQVWLNGAQALLATLRWGGVVVVLLVAPEIQAFFLWQAAVSVASVLVLGRKTYLLLPQPSRGARFSLEEIRSVGRFAGGMTTIALLALLLTQIDKLLLSGLLTLDQFGYYALASLLSGALVQLVTPINAAVYPRFTELVTRCDEAGLVKTYHDSCQLMSAIIIPPALLLACFADPVLLLWTGNRELTALVAPVLSLLALGTLFNGFMNVPYMLQLAHGWTGYAIRVNTVAVALIVPAILWTVPRYGAIGAAWIWLVLNAAYVTLAAHFMYRRLLPGQKLRWYRDAVIRPLLAGGLLAGGLAWLMPTPQGRADAALEVLLAGLGTGIAVILALPDIRRRIMAYNKGRRND